MEFLEPLHNLREDVPDVGLLEVLALALVLEYFLQEVASVRVLHNYADYLESLYQRDFEPGS